VPPPDDYCRHAGRLDAAGWVLDALEPDDAERFSAHLFGCRTCQLTVEELETAAQLLLGSGVPPPPADLELATMDRVRQAARRLR
jgi:Putative zinc-finger